MEHTNEQIILYAKERSIVQTLLKIDEVSSIVTTRSNWWSMKVRSARSYLKEIKSEADTSINITKRELIYFTSNILKMILFTLPDELDLIEFIRNLEHTNVTGKNIIYSIKNLNISFDQPLDYEHKILFLFLAYAYENKLKEFKQAVN